MSWIRDVKHELDNLDLSEKNLKKNGFVIGVANLIAGGLIYILFSNLYISIFLIILGLIIILSSFLFPKKLSFFYKVWMGFAFAVGWIISRILLAAIFIIIVSPIAIIAKLFGKQFLDLKFHDNKSSYWIQKKNKIDYQKLY
ncbi:SxtJ family membrane protein [Bacteroidota bacterium]